MSRPGHVRAGLIGRALVALLALLLAMGGPGVAQDGSPGSGPNLIAREAVTGEAPPTAEALDYDAWGREAARAEALLAQRVVTPLLLEQMRASLADWRAAFQTAQGTNRSRIATLRAQIAALGPAPTDGQIEAAEIADRRSDLNEQLVRLEAPGRAAEEAYSRAEGLITEIDLRLREQQTAQLLRLLPAPINPAHWPDAARSVAETARLLWRETADNAVNPDVRQALVANLPLILGLLILSVLLLWRGRRWFERWPNRLQQRASSRGAEVWALLASMGQIVVPVGGVFALSLALQLTELPGPQGTVILAALTVASFAQFGGRWLGFRLFPRTEPGRDGLHMSAEMRRKGRTLATVLGLLMALEVLRQVVLDPLRQPESAQAVLALPLIVMVGVALFHMGQFLRAAGQAGTGEDESVSYRDGLFRMLGSATMIVAVIGPLLAAVGYVPAALALIFPFVRTLALLGLIFVMQKLVRDLFALVTGDTDGGGDALLPVLIGFLLTLATLPLFALVWGARTSELTEMFTRMRTGFQLGATRISPTDFLVFGLVFGLGWAATRLLQGALKATILPRTSLDLGGQNAIVVGVGYVGLFLAALVAINTTGIDLSGLAIVAGALSVGIGFGLQTIVSNFVSGIILLIERPVSEGDWIEVGGVQGRVRSISVRSTRIETFDRTDVIVPNTDLIAGQVTNWTRFNLTGRIILRVGVAYGSDTRKVERVLREIAEAQPMAVLNPPPAVLLSGFGADSIDFEIRLILRDVNFGLSVRSEINHQIAERFAAEGIEIPFAQRDIWLRNPETLTGGRSFAAAPGGPPAPDATPQS